jgi:hyaluronan synthase
VGHRPTPSVDRTRRNGSVLVTVVAFTLAGLFGWHHVLELVDEQITNLRFIVAVSFVALIFTAIVPYFQRDIRAKPGRIARLGQLRVCAIVPAHNEDPAMFLAMLRSVARQQRLPQRLHIVENGYAEPKLHAAFERWRAQECPTALQAVYSLNLPAGKREAQAVAIAADPDADIYLTIDSDVELGSTDAVAKGIAPFADPNVTSVCGFLLGSNWNHNLLARLVDLSFICSFLNGRASHSMLSSVAVNTGGLAFYRGPIVRKYMHHYLSHRIFGRQMQYGDDAMLTRYSLLEGRTLFQRACWGFTLHPENRKHLAKQRTRWHRSFFWGNLWLLRTFSPWRAIWWLTLWQFVAFVWFTAALPMVLLVHPIMTGEFAWLFLAAFTFVSYLSTMPYLTVRRPDQTFRQQFGIWLLAPVSSALNLYIGWWLRYVGLFTCLKTGWSTRGQVEVGLSPPPM